MSTSPGINVRRYTQLKKCAENLEIAQCIDRKSEEYAQFMDKMIEICLNRYKITKNIDDTEIINGTVLEAFAWRWLSKNIQQIPNICMQDLLIRVKIHTRDKIKKTNKQAKGKRKRRLSQSKEARRNLFSLKKDLRLSYFQKPIESEVHQVSLHRSEFGQYLNEVVYLFGKITDIRFDQSKKGQKYTKILLTCSQFYPAGLNTYAKHSIYLPDHIWVDISKNNNRNQKYQLNDYVIFSGTVCEYDGWAKQKSINYWRTKFGLAYPKFEQAGTPELTDQNRIKNLNFTERPDDLLNTSWQSSTIQPS